MKLHHSEIWLEETYSAEAARFSPLQHICACVRCPWLSVQTCTGDSGLSLSSITILCSLARQFAGSEHVLPVCGVCAAHERKKTQEPHIFLFLPSGSLQRAINDGEDTGRSSFDDNEESLTLAAWECVTVKTGSV